LLASLEDERSGRLVEFTTTSRGCDSGSGDEFRGSLK
jgi:hypothetical protein